MNSSPCIRFVELGECNVSSCRFSHCHIKCRGVLYEIPKFLSNDRYEVIDIVEEYKNAIRYGVTFGSPLQGQKYTHLYVFDEHKFSLEYRYSGGVLNKEGEIIMHGYGYLVTPEFRCSGKWVNGVLVSGVKHMKRHLPDNDWYDKRIVSYDGTFKNGKRHGMGKCCVVDDGRYWCIVDGMGDYTIPASGTYTTYDGTWVENEFTHGEIRTIIHGTTFVYKGDVKNDLFDGQGEFSYGNDEIKGEWKNGFLVNGEISTPYYTYKGGVTQHMGARKYFDPHGEGIFTFKDRGIVLTGTFVNGNMTKGDISWQNPEPRILFSGTIEDTRIVYGVKRVSIFDCRPIIDVSFTAQGTMTFEFGHFTGKCKITDRSATDVYEGTTIFKKEEWVLKGKLSDNFKFNGECELDTPILHIIGVWENDFLKKGEVVFRSHPTLQEFEGDVETLTYKTPIILTGTGRLTYNNQDVYTGSVKNGKRFGVGTLVKEDGEEITGYWDDDKIETDAALCKLCEMYKIDAVFTSCGHIGCCIACAKKLTKCPFCNRHSGSIKIFYV